MKIHSLSGDFVKFSQDFGARSEKILRAAKLRDEKTSQYHLQYNAGAPRPNSVQHNTRLCPFTCGMQSKVMVNRKSSHTTSAHCRQEHTLVETSLTEDLSETL